MLVRRASSKVVFFYRSPGLWILCKGWTTTRTRHDSIDHSDRGILKDAHAMRDLAPYNFRFVAGHPMPSR